MAKQAERETVSSRGTGTKPAEAPPAPFANTIGQTRYIVLLAVVAVLLVAMALFLLGTVMAIWNIWLAIQAVLAGDFSSTSLTVKFLEVVSVMLKAVVFYIIGTGFYSLFIAPLNLTAALGVESLGDLETKIVSVIIVIMALTFLEHFIEWEKPDDLLKFAGAIALVSLVLVLFQWLTAYTHEAARKHHPDAQVRAQRELFERDEQKREVREDEVDTAAATDGATDADTDTTRADRAAR